MESAQHLIVDQIAPGVLLERSANGQLITFTLSNGAPRTLKVWAEALTSVLVSLPEGAQHYLFLQDLHHSGPQAFGAQMQRDFEALYKLRPDLRQSMAIVMPASFSADVARLAIRMRELKEKLDYPIHWRVFTSRKEAMNWLQKQQSSQ